MHILLGSRIHYSPNSRHNLELLLIFKMCAVGRSGGSREFIFLQIWRVKTKTKEQTKNYLDKNCSQNSIVDMASHLKVQFEYRPGIEE